MWKPVIIVSTLVLAGCGPEHAEVGSPPDTDLSATCGSVTFESTPPVLDEFPPLDADAQSALDELVNGPTGVEAAGFDEDYRWSIASRSDDRLVLFGQGEGPDTGTVDAQFVRDDGGWTPRSWGGCTLKVSADGFGPARVATELDRSFPPDATELSLVINELNCASGEAPIDREVIPIVTETDDAVSIIVLVEEVTGDAECPGNPWHPITITLDAPLGDRQLLEMRNKEREKEKKE